MNPKKNTHVTNGHWSCGTISGYGIDGYIISVHKHYTREQCKDNQYRIKSGQLDGVNVKTSEEAEALKLLYGYTKYYSRNTIKFVMSRAARKRGYKTTDRMYCDRVKDTPRYIARKKARKAGNPDW